MKITILKLYTESYKHTIGKVFVLSCLFFFLAKFSEILLTSIKQLGKRNALIFSLSEAIIRGHMSGTW